MPLDKFPAPDAAKPYCWGCTGLWMLYRERPTEKWITFPCTGCEVQVRAPSKARSARARLCVSCYEGWQAFHEEVERRRMRGELK